MNWIKILARGADGETIMAWNFGTVWSLNAEIVVGLETLLNQIALRADSYSLDKLCVLEKDHRMWRTLTKEK